MTGALLLYVVLPSVLLALLVVFLPMPIRDRYVLRKFAMLFFISLILEVALILIVRLGDRELGTIFNENQPMMQGLLIYLYHAPERVMEVIPAAGILAAFFTIGGLTRSNELIAFRASGFNLYRTTVPILLFTVGCALVALLFADRIVAPATRRAWLLDRDRTYEADREIVFRDASGAFSFIQSLDLPRKTARNLTFYELDGNRLRRQVFATAATWEPGVWHLQMGWIREYDPNGPGTFERFAQLDRPLGADLRVLIASASDPATMTFAELQRVIRLKRSVGRDARREIVRFQHNIAYPFALVVGVLLTLPLSMQFGRFAIAIGFPATMLISFLYWGMGIAIFEAMGENGRLPAALAPWIANAIFAAVGLVLFRGIRR